MKNYKFGKTSSARLKTCHPDIQKIMKLALSRSHIDFGISDGHRSVERQYELYQQGRSKIDGKRRKGKHNYSPSMAADIYIYHPHKATRMKLAYDIPHLCYVAGLIFSAAQELLAAGEIEHSVRWGANWDGDGVIALDQSFDDYPHFELINIIH